jgi:peptidyl-prolyl cis-trans isomerase A (cyclophilin A)
MRSILALACLGGLLLGGEVRIKVAKGLLVADMVSGYHATTGHPVLYPSDALAGRTVPGTLDVTVPRNNAHDFLVFALSTCGLQARRYPSGNADIQPLAVVLPTSSLVTDFRLTGLDLPLVFDRGPAGWRTDADLPGSLSATTTQALLDRLKAVDGARAAWLLGYLGPRSPEVVGGLVAALGEDGAVPGAAWALARCGHVARPNIPALKQAIQHWGARHADALQRAVRLLENALHPSLLDPSRARETAPERFSVRLETTRGEIEIEVTRAWSPRGADRFYSLVRIGFFDGAPFYRVVRGFVAQFGKHPDPRVSRAWYPATIRDDPPRKANAYGYVTFAKTDDPHSRATEVFINLKDNDHLDKPGSGFAPFGRVVKGMKVAEALCSKYGNQPKANRIHYDGDKYLRRNFPELDYIRQAVVVE